MRTNTVTLARGKDLSRNEPSFIFSRYFSLALSLFSLCKSLTNSTGRDERRKMLLHVSVSIRRRAYFQPLNRVFNHFIAIIETEARGICYFHIHHLPSRNVGRGAGIDKFLHRSNENANTTRTRSALG